MADILIVDDRPDEEARGFAHRLSEMGHRSIALHPTDLDAQSLREADLILVDYELAAAWDQSDLPVTNRCANGWALASNLRWQMAEFDNRPTPGLVALLTNEIGKALNPFDMGGSTAAGIVSSLNGVEWVFSKQAGEDMLTQICALANAIPCVRSSMRVDDLLDLLKAPEGAHYWGDLLSAGIPATELLDWREGVAIFRWMMQRVLPYPTFLISDLWLACRLGVKLDAVEMLLASDSELARDLGQCRYQGFLHNFLGRRWWARAVERVLWEATNGESSSLGEVRRLVATALSISEGSISEGGTFPVITVDRNFREIPRLVDGARCKRVRPEWWPAAALDVWAEEELIEDDEKIRAAVL